MAIVTYGDIVKQVRMWTNRSDLTDDEIYTFVYFTGNAANQLLRVPAMEHTEVLEVSDGGKVTIPSDYLELRSMTALTGDPGGVPLERVAWDQFINYRNSAENEGRPRYFARQGPYIWMTPSPAIGSKLTMHYYRSMPDLSPAESVNWLSDLSPMCYVYGALHFAYLYLFDEERATFWQQKFQSEAERIQLLADNAEHRGSSLTVRPRNPGGI